MNKSERKVLLVTFVETFGPYLKISGQLNPDAIGVVQSKIQYALKSGFAIDSNLLRSSNRTILRPGTLCLCERINNTTNGSKYDMTTVGGELCRARITSLIQPKQNITQVEVEFIDYGYSKTVPCNEIVFLHHQEILKNIPPLCSQFIMLGIYSDWTNADLVEISRMILNQTLDISIETEINKYKFINLNWKEYNLSEFLIHQKKLGAPIQNDLLRDNFLTFLNKQQQQEQQQLHQYMPHMTSGGCVGVGLGDIIIPANNNNNNLYQSNINNNSMYAVTNNRELSLSADRRIMPTRQNYPNGMNYSTARMPGAIGNLRAMIQGIQHQNTQIPYTGHSINAYIPRYCRPTPPEPLRSPAKRAIASFKSNNLAVGSVYDVCISFVENGPCLFSVQVVSSQGELTKMMNQIENIPLKQINEKPALGTACIARYSEDGQLYRALITGVQPTTCKVAYIDYGNTEMVEFRDLFEIPEEFLNFKVFAIRFTLSGYKDLEPIDDSLKKAFKDMVIYKNCRLKVMPLEGPPLVQYCELYLNENNILETLKQIQKCRLVYTKAEPLNTNDIVEIRYIDSPKHFYVQKVCNIEVFESLMDDMFVYYNKKQNVPNHLEVGAPCIVKYDNEWYRAEVMRADSSAIIVRHVDFGYEQKVTKNLLSTIAKMHLILPRQAVQCCLKGFENNELCKDLATTQFEMLAEESNRSRRSFTVKVFRIQPNGMNLVNLCTKELNVMKKLYKLCLPFDQYLSLEKEEFNIYSNDHGLYQNGQQRGGANSKTPSIASSADVAGGVVAGKKGHFLNSTALQNDQTNEKRLSSASFSTEWDKNSSASSTDPWDSRSSSKEHKKRRSGVQHQEGGGGVGGAGGDRLNNRMSENEKRSNYGSSGNYNKGCRNLPPRLQSLKNQENEIRRQNKLQNKQQSPLQPKIRPQHNAPLGYSQPRKPAVQQDRTLVNSNSDELSSGNEEMTIEEYVPLDREFPRSHIDVPAREDVVICWWISPHQFYTHLKSRNEEFERLMRRLQTFYQNKPVAQLPLKVGSNVIARYCKDNILYRARIIACNQMLRKFKVHFVDFGNQYTVSDQDIWQVEKRFTDFPCMAYLCSFNGIVSNYEHLYIIDRMEKYLPAGSVLNCEYIERDEEMYYVNVNVNKLSLRETLKTEGLITEVCPELRLDLLAGQQIRAKITSITDMLNFKIHIEGCDPNIQMLCSYDDVRFVKSNSDVAAKFKEFYDGKSVVLNISNVTDDKVILAKPLLPLWIEDIPTYICSYPLILETFNARVVYVNSPNRLYVQMVSLEPDIAQLIDDMFEYYDQGGNTLKNPHVDNICAACGSDGNWYRARVSAKKSVEMIEVVFVDYGNTEVIDIRETTQKTKLKRLEPQFYTNKSAYAIEINLPIRSISADLKNKKKKILNTTNDNNEEKDDDDATVIQEIISLTSYHELTVKAIEVRKNRLIADLCSNDYSIVDILKEKGLLKGGKDLSYIRKVIDEGPPNVLSYIETVDLTIEEEDVATFKTAAPTMKESTVVTSVPFTTTTASVVPLVPPRNISPKKQPIVKEVTATTAVKPSAHVEKWLEPEPVSTFVIATPTPQPEPEPQEDPYKDMEAATLSHCDNPNRFFLHLQSKTDELHNLQENLQIVASSLPPLMRVLKGANCISLYSVDHQWYRAKIMDAELMVVQFIDYGNTDALTDSTDIKEMSVFPDIEPLCISCALAIKPNNTADWVDAANAIFNESYNKTLYFEYITRGDEGKKNFISLFIDGVNIADKLIADGFATPLVMVPSGENCFVSHVNSLSDFYIQMEKDAGALALIESYLSESEKFSLIEKFANDLICAALFPDDGNWYRAKLLAEVTNGFEVLFIDYGNTAITPEVRKISREIAELPFLSKKCAFKLPDDVLCWSDAAEEKFSEISALGETVFVVELKEPSEHAIVHLFVDGHNIIDDLGPMCHRKPQVDSDMNASFCNSTLQTSLSESYRHGIRDAVISHVNSPCDFFIQFKSDGDKLDDMTTTLNEITMNKLEISEVGMICAAVFPDDGAYYRSRILEKCTSSDEYRVIFIDFGNEATTKDLRVLPDDLQCIKDFSKRCSLENAQNLGERRIVVETFNALIDECSGMVKVEVVNDEHSPSVVTLYTNGLQNISEKLNHLLCISSDTVALTSSLSPVKTCFISHAVSPNEFYIQMKSQTVNLDRIAKELEQASISPMVTQPAMATLYAAFSREDQIYYRAVVQKVISNDEYEVFFVDFGNTAVTNVLRILPDDLRSIPSIAQKCRLNEVPTEFDETLILEHFSALLESHFGEMFQIDDMTQEKDVLKVKLQIEYKDVADELRTEIENEKTQIVLSPAAVVHNCTIIHVNSPNSFYALLSDDVPQVEKITDTLLDADTDFEKFEDLHVGAICAAQFPEDGAFYRAKILSVSGKECEVIYLDFGNTAITEQFRKLPADMIDIEPYGKHCALENMSGIDFWSADANMRFSQLIDSRFSETFQVEVLKASTDPIIVRLFYQETNVATELADAIKATNLTEHWQATTNDVNPSSGVSSMGEDKHNEKE